MSSGSARLVAVWRDSGRHIAVTLGSGVALLSLLADAPVRIASLRGAIAYFVTLGVTGVGAWFLERTWVEPEPEPVEPSGDGGASPD